ncbi:MAG: ABC transporter permease [Actinobacteria bacterium]|nr:ABC transporter permease [Actinomycetota bacterium]
MTTHEPAFDLSSESPGKIALRTLVRDRRSWVASIMLVLVVALTLFAPFYASLVSKTDPFVSTINGTVVLDGVEVQVLQQSTEGLKLGVNPIGPTWKIGPYFLGADNQGRDVAARLLYGGTNTLLIGFLAAALTLTVATLVGVIAGYSGKIIDSVISRILDVIWAFPVYLLSISLSVVLLTSGFKWGPLSLEAGSLYLPIFIIGLVYVPYVARPIRGQVLALREREFVKAAIGGGAKNSTIIFREILPNVIPSVLVFIPLMVSLAMLTESALSFLSIGVQPPDASWGTIIKDGLGLLYTRPMVALTPGLFIVITAVALNLLGDAVRDALDPKARLRGAF